MIWQKVSLVIPPVTLAASTNKVVIAVTTPTSRGMRLASIVGALVGAGATDPMGTWQFGLLSGAAAGGHTCTPQKSDREVYATPGITALDASTAFTGTVPTLSAAQKSLPLFPQWTFNPADAGDFNYVSGDVWGLTVNPGTGSATVFFGTVSFWEPV